MMIAMMTGVYSLHAQKMNGVSFVSPPRKVEAEVMQPVKNIGATWIAISPFAFSRPNEPKVIFGGGYQWWGETPKGAAELIRHAQASGLKVMLKPQVWLRSGWTGTYDLDSEEKWAAWEQDYERYILTFARLADSMKVDLFCIGTEYRIAVKKRQAFWNKLIQKVRTVFNGKLTYAANWDDYDRVPFWSDLDYIGIDAYFPLDSAQTPGADALVTQWQPAKTATEALQRRVKKPVLFTEYGYMSMNQAAWRNWELEKQWMKTPNMEAQKQAFEAVFKAFWHEPWFAGGFIWKWYDNHPASGGVRDTDYTPQNKPAELTVKNWYTKTAK